MVLFFMLVCVTLLHCGVSTFATFTTRTVESLSDMHLVTEMRRQFYMSVSCLSKRKSHKDNITSPVTFL